VGFSIVRILFIVVCGAFHRGAFLCGFFRFSACSYWVLCGVFPYGAFGLGFFDCGFLFIVGCGASSTLIESCLLWGFPLDLPVIAFDHN
jgi:hypothetical protein